jgi:flagellar biosynthesis/type III secretory pathway protein FliH
MNRYFIVCIFLAFLVCLGGCESTDAKIQAAYDNGLADGRTAGYDEGYNAALADTEALQDTYIAEGREDGYTAGQSDGYATGYDDGNTDGYTLGYDDGYADGYDAGYETGGYDGYYYGYDQGESAGQVEGYQYGYTEGKTDMVTGGDTTVYVTRSGTKYHQAGCTNLTASKIPMALSEAIAQGYSACSKCN